MILKMIDYDFSIQDFVQGGHSAIAILTFRSIEVS